MNWSIHFVVGAFLMTNIMTVYRKTMEELEEMTDVSWIQEGMQNIVVLIIFTFST